MRHLLLASVLIAAPASADSLREAIASAYSSNPQIAAARAQLRQVDEGVPIASSGARPSVDLQGNFTQDLNDNFRDLGQVWTGGIVLRQSIWEGGRVRAGVSAAEARIEAARARLRAIEYRVIVDTAVAYADVIRTQALVGLNQGQVKVLEQELRASRDRFEVGDLTRTDVAQSEARLALANANLQAARGQLVVAQQAYRRLVGRPPQNLEPLPELPAMPATVGEALDLALATNPTLMAARLDERAAAEDVRLAKAGRGPSVGVQASANYTEFTGAGAAAGLSGFDPRVGVTAAMPLFTGGLIAAQVRQAQARQSQALEGIAQNERLVTESTTDSWELLRTAEAVIQSSKVQVDANALAAEGVRQENQVGSRDILDVLNAEQELLNSRVNLVQAERDRYVAAFQLYESIGQLEVALANAPVGRHDPEANAKRVRGLGWSEFSTNPDPRKDRERDHVPLVGPQQ
jgi:outer membrane protein